MSSSPDAPATKTGNPARSRRAIASGGVPPCQASTRSAGSVSDSIGSVENAMVRPFRRGAFSRVGLNVGLPMPANPVQPEVLRARVAALM
mgnify:CR=1 FL=1